MLKVVDAQIAYGDTVVVEEFNLSVSRGEFITFLGPSGCGKTTLLRAIAGFVPLRKGRIEINGRDVTKLPPDARDIGIVFQNYALFPHMTVRDNVAFGLKVARASRAETQKRVDEALEATGIAGHAHKRPETLSGGQQQRVAIARSLVVGAQVLLFDEPLSNLDAKIRESMRAEIKRLQRALDFTAVFVTHDQEEALALSDRLVVLSDGHIKQIGTGREIYRHPGNPFVCQFVGDAIEIKPGQIALLTRGGLEPRPGVEYFLRPEALRIIACGDGDGLPATVEDSFFLGRTVSFELSADQQRLSALMTSETAPELRSGDKVALAASPDAVFVFERHGAA